MKEHKHEGYAVMTRVRLEAQGRSVSPSPPSPVTSSSMSDQDESLDYETELHRKPSGIIKQTLWERYHDKDEPNIFGYHEVTLANDGGMRDVWKLLYSMQYVYAFTKVLLVVINCYVITTEDTRAILQDIDEKGAMTEARNKFLVTAWIACKPMHCGDGSTVELRLHTLIPILEIAYLSLNIAAVCVCALAFVIVRRYRPGPKWERFRWSMIAHLFFEWLQELVSCSALKLLYFVTPTVLATQAYNCIIHAQARQNRVRAFFDVVWFICKRSLVLVMGFDAFLVKFRIASDYIDRGEMTLNGLVVAMTFLFQVLGAAKINHFVQERLIIFIFGGEDGQLDPDEKHLSEIWQALLVRQVYQTYDFWSATIVMLGFDDYDFQMLVLDDKEEEIRETEAALVTGSFESIPELR